MMMMMMMMTTRTIVNDSFLAIADIHNMYAIQ